MQFTGLLIIKYASIEFWRCTEIQMWIFDILFFEVFFHPDLKERGKNWKCARVRKYYQTKPTGGQTPYRLPYINIKIYLHDHYNPCVLSAAWCLVPPTVHSLYSLFYQATINVDNAAPMLKSQAAYNFTSQFAEGRQFAVQLWHRALLLTVCCSPSGVTTTCHSGWGAQWGEKQQHCHSWWADGLALLILGHGACHQEQKRSKKGARSHEMG